MELLIEISSIIQDDKILETASTFIQYTELTKEIRTYNFKVYNNSYRLKTTDNGSITLEIYTSCNLEIHSSFNPIIKSFFKPIGFFYFTDTSRLRFTILKEFELVSIKQDEIFNKSEKRIDVYRSSEILWDAIIACFSAEIRIAIAIYFEFMTIDKIGEVATPDSMLITWTFNKPLSVNGLDLKLLTTADLTMIQIYLLNNEKIKYPIAAYVNENEIKINPNLQEKLEQIQAHELLTVNRI